jgi:VanZ family protein
MRKLINQLLQQDKLLKVTAVVSTLIVVYLSLKPPEPDSEPWSIFFIRGDLFLHFVCYFMLSIIYYLAMFNNRETIQKALILSLLVGFTLEGLQLIPVFKRFFDLKDLVANSFGSSVGIIFIQFLFSHSIQD